MIPCDGRWLSDGGGFWRRADSLFIQISPLSQALQSPGHGAANTLKSAFDRSELALLSRRTFSRDVDRGNRSTLGFYTHSCLALPADGGGRGCAGIGITIGLWPAFEKLDPEEMRRLYGIAGPICVGALMALLLLTAAGYFRIMLQQLRQQQAQAEQLRSVLLMIDDRMQVNNGGAMAPTAVVNARAGECAAGGDR